MKLSKRETRLIQVLIVIGSLSLSAYFVVNPTLLKVAEFKEKSTSADATMMDYETKIEIANSIGNNLEVIKKEAMKEAEFAYDLIHNYRVDQIIQEFTNKNQLSISSLLIENGEDEGTSMSYQEYDQNQRKKLMEEGSYVPKVRTVDVELSVSASRDQIIQLIDDINQVDKSLYIQSFSINEDETTTAFIHLVFEQVEQAAFK